MNCLIKICGITDVRNALVAAEKGSDFVGMVFHALSKRNVEMQQAQEIVAALKPTKTQVVAVFVKQTAAEMLAVCKDLNINVVQLHGDTVRQQHHLLPESIQRIYVCNVNSDGKILADIDGGLHCCKRDRDFLLFDNVLPGSGKTFDWDGLKNSTEFRWFLSGGLTPENVTEGIHLLKPNGVDVSSGVESFGVKSEDLICAFINKVKPIF